MEGLQRLERSAEENNREYVFRLLRYHIMTLKLPPGTVIKENEIARQLNLSRTPVHEAVLMLKEQYLMDVLPQSGSKVSLVDINIMREGYFLRKRIEPEIIRQLAGNTPPEILKRLHDNLKTVSYTHLIVVVVLIAILTNIIEKYTPTKERADLGQVFELGENETALILSLIHIFAIAIL